MIETTFQHPASRLLLASTSPTRRQLLAATGLTFEYRDPGLDENPIKRAARAAGRSAGEAALLLAEAKAEAVSRAHTDGFVIGADQILSSGATWFDKPPTLLDARRHLLAQRGEEQTLHTAAAIASRGTIIWRHLVEPRIRMRRFSDDLLDRYLAAEGETLLGCVGACRIEGPGQLLIEAVEAEHAAILGLPILALLAELRRIGILLG